MYKVQLQILTKKMDVFMPVDVENVHIFPS